MNAEKINQLWALAATRHGLLTTSENAGMRPERSRRRIATFLTGLVGAARCCHTVTEQLRPGVLWDLAALVALASVGPHVGAR